MNEDGFDAENPQKFTVKLPVGFRAARSGNTILEPDACAAPAPLFIIPLPLEYVIAVSVPSAPPPVASVESPSIFQYALRLSRSVGLPAVINVLLGTVIPASGLR